MTPSLDKRGFTLLEVLAAILIFAFGIMALFRVQIGSINSNSFSNDLSQATKLAQDRIDYLMGLELTDTQLSDTKGKSGTITNYGLDNHTAADADGNAAYGRYNIFWNVALDQPLTGSRTIRVIVTWTDKRDVSHTITMDTIKGSHY